VRKLEILKFNFNLMPGMKDITKPDKRYSIGYRVVGQKPVTRYGISITTKTVMDIRAGQSIFTNLADFRCVAKSDDSMEFRSHKAVYEAGETIELSTVLDYLPGPYVVGEGSTR
jgi:hypothetical protein